MLRFLLNGKGFSIFIEFHYAVFPGISYIIPKNRGALLVLRAVMYTAQHAGKTLSVKNIVAQNKRNGIGTYKVRPDNKGVSQTSGLLLHCVFEFHSQLASVLKKITEHREIPWSGNDQHFPDPCKHQCR